MIITRTQASALVQNHQIVQALPELLPFVEQAKTIRNDTKPGCAPCRQRAALSPVGDAVLLALSQMPEDRIALLKNYLNDQRIFIYDPQVKGASKLMELPRQ